MIKNTGQFQAGHVPWNKGIRRAPSPKCLATCFTSENVGPKHVGWKGGVQQTKRDGAFLWAGPHKRKRRSRHNWEAHYGPIPSGMCVWHKDGNKDNDHISNLELVTRAEMAKRNRKNRRPIRRTNANNR